VVLLNRRVNIAVDRDTSIGVMVVGLAVKQMGKHRSKDIQRCNTIMVPVRKRTNVLLYEEAGRDSV